ncbi:hypothetical protein J4404_00210 [Candidatus Woesearchaeota archaeon]|nr:hypothetical protein [Candidatus Woesearchaeota archaeon]
MVTTIQIHENVKNELDRFKDSKKETYEEVILELIRSAEKCRREQKELLIEGYKEMVKESLNATKEWANADKDW